MSLLIVGSMAFDTIQTPTESRERVLGGSAVYASYAASLHAPVRLVGIVGNDWLPAHTEMLESRGIDLRGVRRVADQRTFYWKGRYLSDMNERESLETDLNVFENFRPEVPPAFADTPFVLLANAHPRAHLCLLDQLHRPQFVMADTHELWIQTGHQELLQLLARIDGLILNDSEARLLTGLSQLVEAGRAIQKLGPRYVIIKKGEHGAMLFSDGPIASLPAFPTDRVVDPTGAGDTFAGGLMGYLSQQSRLAERDRVGVDALILRKAMALGTLVASFTVEDFSLERLQGLTSSEMASRMEHYREMLRF